MSLDGKNALVAPDAHPDDFSAEVEGSSLVLKGSAGRTKRFRLDTARRAVEISYSLTNATTAPLRGSARI